MDVRDIATDALRHAKEADHAESYVIRSVTNSAYIDGGKISNIETKVDSGISVRVVKDGRPGRACMSLGGPASAGACAASAVRVSAFSPENSGFKGFPMPSKQLMKADAFDKKIEDAGDAELKEMLNAVISSCAAEIPRGMLRLSVIASAVANTNGLVAEHRGTMMYGHFTSVFSNGKKGEGTESVYGPSLSFDAERIGAELERKAKASASAAPFRGREKMTVIIPPCELGDMMMSSAGSALNGENVFYGRSPWTGKIDEKVASIGLTITDDPGSKGPLCSSFDDEGTPSRKKILVEKGILKGFMRDSFTGDSTGNGIRRDPTDAQGVYCAAPRILPMNMTVAPGRYTQDDIIAQTDNGILVEKFAWPEADPLTGRFGLEVRCGHIIKNGRIEGTVNNALLMGNMFDALNSIELIGKDNVNRGCVTVPPMSFSGTELVGN